MLGAIIGDVIGSIYEVNEIKALKEKRNNYKNRIKILDKSVPLFTSECSYTDDTVLTVAVAHSLLNDKNYYKYLKEFGKKEMSLGIDKYGRNRFSSRFIDWLNGDYIGNSYGNGCAMRISPIANYCSNFDDMIKEIYNVTCTSHKSTESIKASIAVSYAIYLAKNRFKKETIKKFIEKQCDYNLNYDLEQLQKNYKFTSRAKDSIPQAIYCFLISNDFEDAIRKAISIGGDSDTIAAITGSIAEAYYDIDNKLIKSVEKYLPEYVINITNNFYEYICKPKPFKNDVKDFFKAQGLYSEDFFDYIKNRVVTLPSCVPLQFVGCFPQVENGVLKDIRVSVPKTDNDENMLVNIHEYYHALELFNELGSVYEDKKEERENKAKEIEKVYKIKKSI